jgi:hypothetical protein
MLPKSAAGDSQFIAHLARIHREGVCESLSEAEAAASGGMRSSALFNESQRRFLTRLRGAGDAGSPRRAASRARKSWHFHPLRLSRPGSASAGQCPCGFLECKETGAAWSIGRPRD